MKIGCSVLSICICLLVHCTFVSAQKITPWYGEMPAPPTHRYSLFYLQRTMDRNTVVYDLNIDAAGNIDMDEPVNIYWIDYEEGGSRSELTLTQKKLAYGLKVRLTDRAKKIWQLQIVSYKKLKLVLKPDKNGVHKVYTRINGKEAQLRRLLIYLTGGTYFDPDVKYIELEGIDIDGKVVTGRVNP